MVSRATDLATENADLRAENRRRSRERDDAKLLKGDVRRKAEATEFLLLENRRLRELAEIRKDALVSIILKSDDPMAVSIAKNALVLLMDTDG